MCFRVEGPFWNWVTIFVPLDLGGALTECGCHLYTLSILVAVHWYPHSKPTFLLSHYLSLVHENEEPVAYDFGVLAKALFPSPRLCELAGGASVWEITHHAFASGSTLL